MALVPMKQVLDEAVKGGYGVGAYNVNNMEQIQAIMAAAQATQSPVIVQASRGALKYSNFIVNRYQLWQQFVVATELGLVSDIVYKTHCQ